MGISHVVAAERFVSRRKRRLAVAKASFSRVQTGYAPTAHGSAPLADVVSREADAVFEASCGRVAVITPETISEVCLARTPISPRQPFGSGSQKVPYAAHAAGLNGGKAVLPRVLVGGRRAEAANR